MARQQKSRQIRNNQSKIALCDAYHEQANDFFLRAIIPVICNLF